MGVGVPAVASPVGINNEFIQQGVNGFLVNTESEWYEALNTLCTVGNDREQMGVQGRRRLEDVYSQERYAGRYLDIMQQLIIKAP